VNAPSPSPRPPGVPSGGHRLLALAALLLLAAPAPGGDGAKPAPAQAQARRKTEEEVLLEAIGEEWKAGDVKALAARFPEKRKVALRLPGIDAGEYRAEQAKSVLGDWFKVRSFTKAELKSVKEMTGTYAVRYVRSADRKTVEAELLLVTAVEDRRRVLVSARESP
jgi:hypothetical protein